MHIESQSEQWPHRREAMLRIAVESYPGPLRDDWPKPSDNPAEQKWYHASPQELAPTTLLNLNGAPSPFGGNQDVNDLRGVWMSPSLEEAHSWRQGIAQNYQKLDDAGEPTYRPTHIYEIKPIGRVHDHDCDGYAARSAIVVQKAYHDPGPNTHTASLRTAMPRYEMDPSITVHHHSDAETAGLAQEVLDQDGPYSLWDGLKSTGANMVARDPSGKIHGILALSDFNDVKGMPKNRYSVANINTSTEAPVGTGGRLLQEAAQKALADGKELGVHYVGNHARSWWSAMGANLNGSSGVWSPEGHRALALGEPIPVPHDGLVLDLLTRKMKEPGPYDLEDDGHIGRFPGTARYDAQQRFDDDDWDDDNLLGRLHPNVSGVQPNEHGSYVGWTPSTSDPQSRKASRTAMPWTPDEAKAIRQDKNHPHYWDVPHDPQGLSVNTPDEKENPNPEYLHRGIRVKGPVGRPQIQQILRSGIGQHFTSDIHNAAAFGDPSNHDEGNDYPGAAHYPGLKSVGLIFTIKHPGQQHIAVNPDGENVNADYWHDEHEHTLAAGAPLQVTHIHMKDGGGDWRPLTLPIDTRGHTAALDDQEEDEDEEEFDGNYCKNCGPGDSDWCEACEACDACDIHDNHCKSCGPNDSDWCEACEQCMNCDYHDNHCSYCGPGDSDWCEEHEQCKSCDGNCDPASDALPLHLKTPLMRANERPMFYSDQTGDHEYYFSPNEINPASEAQSRPYMDFPYADDEDPTLDFGRPLRQTNGIDSIPAGTPGAELYRGLTVDLTHPDLAELRRAIYGDKMESYYLGDPNSNKLYDQKNKYGPRFPVTQPGMFPGPYSDKELASPPADPDHLHRHLDALLDHMENSRKNTGLGRHWSTDFNQAMGFSSHHGPYAHENGRLPVRMKAQWKGQGENPYRHETGEDTPGDYSYEQEMNLLPGAPVELHDVEIFHPVTKKWHSLMDEPQRRTASQSVKKPQAEP